MLPWRPWSTRERFDSCDTTSPFSLKEITVLIPARNESASLKKSLPSVLCQGPDIRVIVVDDCSEDDTFSVAKTILKDKGTVIKGRPRPEGWSGKLWALEQGLSHVTTPYVLLMDADIVLEKGTLLSALTFSKKNDLDLFSLMAWLRMENRVEKYFMPAFIYFFKLLYPFSLANSRNKLIAAAAGGFVLVQLKALKEIGAFSSLKNAIIDDCTLARLIKNRGGKIFIGLTKCVKSKREYKCLKDIWQMVERTAYTQLHYNPLLLLVATSLLILSFLIPLAGLFWGGALTFVISLFALSIMYISYLPVLRYYDLCPCICFTLPVVALLYLAMTWSSAWKHYFGKGAVWRGRYYR